MAAPIFKNRSYVYCLGLEPALIDRLSKLGSRFGFRVVTMSDIDECLAGATKTDHLVCVLVNQAQLKDSLVEKMPELKMKIFLTGEGEIPTDSEFENYFLSLMSVTVVSKFKEMAIFNIEKSFSALASDKNLALEENYTFYAGPENLIYSDLVDESVFFRMQMEFSNDVAANFFGYPLDKRAKLHDFLKEVSNQTMGLVSLNLKKIGLDCRGGLTNLVDLKNSEPPGFRNFFSSVQVICNNVPGLTIRLGYIDIYNHPLPDFDSIELTMEESEIEFL